MTKLTGIVGAPVTPFKNDRIDYDTLAKQVNFLIANGVDALAYPMHIGESPSMREQERRDSARALVEAAAGRVPTFINTSAASTEIAAELAGYCGKIGSTGIVLLAPYYWKPGPKEIVDHFVAATSAHGGQLIAYNNVPATGVLLTADICRTLLARIPGFIGLKDASFDMDTFTAYCEIASEAPHPLAVYTGIEHLLTSVPVGGCGCFSALSEVSPRIVRALYDACASSDIARARPLQFKVRRLLARLMQLYPSTIKYAMGLMGRPVGEPRAPIRPLSDAERTATRDELAALGVLDSEPRGWDAAAAPRQAAREDVPV
jgi:4-hydroxy-tetrahydrodipicolinate synthase